MHLFPRSAQPCNGPPNFVSERIRPRVPQTLPVSLLPAPGTFSESASQAEHTEHGLCLKVSEQLLLTAFQGPRCPCCPARTLSRHQHRGGVMVTACTPAPAAAPSVCHQAAACRSQGAQQTRLPPRRTSRCLPCLLGQGVTAPSTPQPCRSQDSAAPHSEAFHGRETNVPETGPGLAGLSPLHVEEIISCARVIL